MNLSDFSVVSTNITSSFDGRTIKKKYSLNTDIDITIFDLKKLMDDYLFSLKILDIPIPRVIDSYIEDDNLIYECENCGKNIIELGLNITNYLEFENYIAKMIYLLGQVKCSDIYFDPHPKNFVFNEKNEIYYVDFFPPYSDDLLRKRLKIAKEDELEIITENYRNFTKDFLMQHFCGDFLNIDKNFEVVFEDIYKIIIELGFYEKSLDQFIIESKRIRLSEDIRIKRNIFLL